MYSLHTHLTAVESCDFNCASLTEDTSSHVLRNPPCYIIQGDNIDKTVRVRSMRVDNQNKSIHYFCSYAARDRVNSKIGENTLVLRANVKEI